MGCSVLTQLFVWSQQLLFAACRQDVVWVAVIFSAMSHKTQQEQGVVTLPISFCCRPLMF